MTITKFFLYLLLFEKYVLRWTWNSRQSQNPLSLTSNCKTTDMAEFQTESTSSLDPILDLLLSVGYADARKTDISASKRLSGGLAWCVAAVNSDGPRFDEVPDDETLTQQEEMQVFLSL